MLRVLDQNLILRKALSELKDVSESLEKNKAQENQDMPANDDFSEEDKDLE